MAGVNRHIDTETLNHIIGLAEGWINIVAGSLTPRAVVAILESEDPDKAIEFIRTMCNQYCDHLKRAVAKVKSRDEAIKEVEMAAPGLGFMPDGSLRPKDS